LKDKLYSLIRLQECDNRIKEVDTKKKEGPLKIQQLEAELTEQEEKFNDVTHKLESLKKERHAIEQAIQDVDNKAEKSNIKLNNIKSNKEYRSALKEIDDLNREKSLKEDTLIQIMEEIENLEKIILKNKDEYDVLKKRLMADKETVNQELMELDKTSGFLENQRKTFSQEVDQDLLKTYLFLKERKGGQAISSIVAGVCQACHLGIPPQQFNELKKCIALMTCPNCNRMIYWGEDAAFNETATMLEQDR
jgi:predicted  nucleic acid-binding Zn-ribbon protein